MQSTAPHPQTGVPKYAFVALAVLTLLGSAALAIAGNTPPVVMGIVQGLGEFLPISSSAHLILVPWFFQWNDSMIGTLTFDVALHVGTLIAVVGYFWRDWLGLVRAVPATVRWAVSAISRQQPTPSPDTHLLIAIIIGTIPGAVIGKLLENVVETQFRNPSLLAVTLSVMGVVLWLVDRTQPKDRGFDQLSWRDALLIGLAQAAAIVPGFSRSGTTLTAARALGFERASAARFSFLLSAPITLAAVLVKLPDMLQIQSSDLPTFLIGVIVSGSVGALSIHFLLGYIRRIGFGIFAVYRIGLALAIVVVTLMRQ
jgi:undecaprenyl-diphosphatase